MYKVFYNSENKIVGYTDSGDIGNFPYVESEEPPILMWNYKVEDGKLKVIKESFTQEEWDEIINH